MRLYIGSPWVLWFYNGGIWVFVYINTLVSSNFGSRVPKIYRYPFIDKDFKVFLPNAIENQKRWFGV